jgi:hypothetical protein
MRDEEEFRRSVKTGIRRLRRGDPTGMPALRDLVEADLDRVCAALSARWLVSILDSYADAGDPVERRNALIVSTWIGMLRIAETVRLMHGGVDADAVERLRGPDQRQVIVSGLKVLSLDLEDSSLNLARRIADALADTPVIDRIYAELHARVMAGDNVMTVFRAHAAKPDRFFPLAPGPREQAAAT